MIYLFITPGNWCSQIYLWGKNTLMLPFSLHILNGELEHQESDLYKVSDHDEILSRT